MHTWKDEAGRACAQVGLAPVVRVDPAGRAFLRRAVKGAGSPAAREVAWAVGELDGVRCYVTGDDVILTREDLTP